MPLKAPAKPLSKTDVVNALADKTGVEKKQVKAILEGLSEIAIDALRKGGPGIFKLHGLVQLKRIDKPARAARRGIDPFTKEERDFPAKPAHSVVKAYAFKPAKDAVN